MIKYFSLIILCLCLHGWASEDAWQEYSFLLSDVKIVCKLPQAPEIWETAEGRTWLKCESDGVLFSAMCQAQPFPDVDNTRMIRKFIKATPPFEGYVCVESTLLQTKDKITVDTTWESKDISIQPWDTVKERRFFTKKGLYSFFVAYSKQVSIPPYSFYFESIKFKK